MKYFLIRSCVCFLILISDRVSATEVIVLGNESMPFCGIVDGKPAGIVVDILNEITAAGGPKFVYKLGLPWKRAQKMIQQDMRKPTAIIPFTRTKSRENSFHWIAKLLPHEIRIHTFNRKKPVTSFEEAINLQTSVIRGSAAIASLKQLGFKHITEVANAELNAKLLANGRTDILIESQWVDTYIWKKIGMDPSTLQIGPKIGDTHFIYIASSHQFPKSITAEIQKSLKVIQDNGKLESILKKWQ